jgi:hypothetical protein
MKRLLFTLLTTAALCPQVQASTIDAIQISTVFGYTANYGPGFPNNFIVFGAPLSYQLSDGSTVSPGVGWIPYSQGSPTRIQTTPTGVVSYEFNAIVNGAMGNGVLLYHQGELSGTSDPLLWSEGELVPTTPLVLSAQEGDATATMSGMARIVFNNPNHPWRSPASSFVPYAAAEGDLVPFTETFTLLNGATWTAETFNSDFSYQISGVVAFVPEPSAVAMHGLGLVALGAALRRRARRQSQAGAQR